MAITLRRYRYLVSGAIKARAGIQFESAQGELTLLHSNLSFYMDNLLSLLGYPSKRWRWLLPQPLCSNWADTYDRDVIQTPTSVTASPRNIAIVRGSENSAQAHSIVTGGLR